MPDLTQASGLVLVKLVELVERGKAGRVYHHGGHQWDASIGTASPNNRLTIVVDIGLDRGKLTKCRRREKSTSL